MNQYLAHLNRKTGRKEPLDAHLKLVSNRAKEYADVFNAGEEGYFAGLLHDLGKYGELFQRRLKGELSGIDHWSAGAWEAFLKLKDKGIASALCIQGHHIGLQSKKECLGKLNPQLLQTNHPLNLKISEVDTGKLLERFQHDGLTLSTMSDINSSIYQWGDNNCASMLDIRMLFSVLVDADFIETEAWFQMDEKGERKYRTPGLPLEPSLALSRLQHYVDTLNQQSASSTAIHKMRRDLFERCIKAAESPPGLFTLTAPTGSGKTLAMLAFALTQAVKHNLSRIILAVPYLNIIEQTAEVYRRVFHPYFSSNALDNYILEHHSLSGTKVEDGKGIVEDEDYNQPIITQNWDAPVVITTNVQLLESLFANRTSACRKLHNLANSVIMFDEAQTLPVSLAIPTLATLSRLAERYHSSVVFATATQPAFSHLDESVKKQCTVGWQPQEIVPGSLHLFDRARRTEVNWLQSESISWSELANKIAGHRQVLCIVNLKKHASTLSNELKHINTSVSHLSTNMCPAHRQAVLDEVRQLLIQNEPCRLISTQCVEAGVDIDFPVVYRAMGPLEAIAQAAGRCNRNGHLATGDVYVFMPEKAEKERLYPDGAYAQAASVTDMMLHQLGPEGLDISEPEIFRKYYQLLYSFARPENHKKELMDAIKLQDFVAVATNYRVIEQDTINVLVPYDKTAYDSLRQEALNDGLSRQWIMKARPYTVSLFRPRHPDDQLYSSLEPIKLKFKKEDESDEWYIYRKEADYDPDTGLTPSLSTEAIIA